MLPRLFVKIFGSTETFEFSYDYSETVGMFKKKIYKKTKIHPKVQRIIFAGKQLVNDRRLVDYSIQRESTLHIVLRGFEAGYDFDHSDYHYSIRNYAKLKKKRNLHTECVVRVNDMNLFVDLVLSIGCYGPLSLILSFIDPVELLYNTMRVNKVFYDTTIQLLSNPNLIKINKYHYHLLFGRYSCVSEPLFMKIITILKTRGEDLKKIPIFDDIPNHYPGGRREKENLVRQACQRGYLSICRLLLENEGFEVDPELLQDIPSRFEIIEYLVMNYSGFNLTEDIFSHFVNTQNWDVIMTILSKNDPPNEKMELLYRAIFGGDGSKHLKKLTLERLLSIEKYIGRPNLRRLYGLDKNIKKIDWNIIEHFFIQKEEDEDDDDDQQQEQQPVEIQQQQQQLNRMESSGFIVALEKSLSQFPKFVLSNREKLIFPVYLPRYELYELCQKAKTEEDVNSVVKFLEEKYDVEQDIHATPPQGMFSYSFQVAHFRFDMIYDDSHLSKREERLCLYDNEELAIVKSKIIQKIISSRKIEFHNSCYADAVKDRKYRIADFLRKCLTKSRPVSLKNCIIQDISRNQSEIALQTMKRLSFLSIKSCYVVSSARDYYDSVSSIQSIFEASLKHKSEEIVDLIIKDWMGKEKKEKKGDFNPLRLFLPCFLKKKEYHSDDNFDSDDEEEKEEVEGENEEKKKDIKFRNGVAIRMLRSFIFRNDFKSIWKKNEGKRSLFHIFGLCVKNQNTEICQELFRRKDWKMPYVVQMIKNRLETVSRRKMVKKMQKLLSKMLREDEVVIIPCFDCKKSLDMFREMFDVILVYDGADPNSLNFRGKMPRTPKINRMVCLDCFQKREKEGRNEMM